MNLSFFSKIIDNYGDAGFTIRLATAMYKKLNPENITIYTDYKDLFYKLIPETQIMIKDIGDYDEKHDFVFFMFQCTPDDYILKKIEKSSKKAFIIDYFTPEKWAGDANNTTGFINGLSIPVEFIVPGLHKKSGGVLDYPLNKKINKTTNNIYLYSPEKITDVIQKGTIWSFKKETHLKKMPFLPQKDFDSYIHGAKYNWIRGEDSFQVALNSGIPFFWEAYKQKDYIHHLKVKAFLDFISTFFNDIKMKNDYFKIINYLNDIETIDIMELKSIYKNFEDNYSELRNVFESIKTHFQNKTNLQDFLIKKVTFL